MPNAAPRRLLLGFAALLAFVFPAGRAAADLVWTPQTGWQLEGGAVAGLTGPEARKAINRMNQARADEEKHNLGSALGAYLGVAKDYPNSIYAPEALFRAGRIHAGRKQYFKAFDNYQQIVARYPNTSRFDETVGLQYHIAALLLNGARNHVWGLFPLFTARDKAVGYFEQILLNAPYNRYSPLALMNVVAGQQYLGNSEEALDALDRMINNYPQSVLAPDAYLKLAQINASLVTGPFYDQTSTNESITYYQDFMILFPGDHHIAEAEKGLDEMKTVLAESKMKLADFYFYKRFNFVAAREFYNEAITVYPDSAVARQAKRRLAEVEAAAQKARHTPPHKKFLGIF